MDFSVKIIKLCENIKGHHSLVNQLERSATSIGANIHEANYAHGKPDFIAKQQIALKECYETEYCLKLFVKSDILSSEAVIDLYNQCGTIRRVLIASTLKPFLRYLTAQPRLQALILILKSCLQSLNTQPKLYSATTVTLNFQNRILTIYNFQSILCLCFFIYM